MTPTFAVDLIFFLSMAFFGACRIVLVVAAAALARHEAEDVKEEVDEVKV